MPLSIRCPRGHKLNVPSKYAGQTVRCPACQSRIVVPGELSAATAAVKDTATQAAPPKLTTQKPVAEAGVESSAAKAIATNAETKSNAEAKPAPVSPPLPPPPPVEQPAAELAAPVIAFAPEDPAAPVPEGGIVPGANASPNAIAKFMRGRNLLASELGYRADRAKRHSVYWLAGTQFVLALFATLPAVWQLTTAQPAPWVHFVLWLSLLQMGYAAWLALVPDYSSAEVAMFATGVLAAVYAGAMSICWLTAPRLGGWLQIGTLKLEYGAKPTLWCTVMVLLAALTAYLCGHVSYRWRKAYRLTVAGK